MTHVRIAVPPGVGDVYWCLTKLQAYRRKHNVNRVTLCVQKCRLQRALDWSRMVSFVDATEEYPFRPDTDALTTGHSVRHAFAPREERRDRPRPTPVDCVWWPNAIVDRGQHLREWMPELDLDLSFPIRTEPGSAGDVVVYVSSRGVNDAWLPNLGVWYWNCLIEELAERTGVVPTLIGKDWDSDFRAGLRCEVRDLVGKTTLPEVAGILERASVLVGVISGMTILANHFRTPTVALHPDKHHPAFPRTWVADDAPYAPIAASTVPAPEELAARAAELARPRREQAA